MVVGPIVERLIASCSLVEEESDASGWELEGLSWYLKRRLPELDR